MVGYLFVLVIVGALVGFEFVDAAVAFLAELACKGDGSGRWWALWLGKRDVQKNDLRASRALSV